MAHGNPGHWTQCHHPPHRCFGYLAQRFRTDLPTRSAAKNSRPVEMPAAPRSTHIWQPGSARHFARRPDTPVQSHPPKRRHTNWRWQKKRAPAPTLCGAQAAIASWLYQRAIHAVQQGLEQITHESALSSLDKYLGRHARPDLLVLQLRHALGGDLNHHLEVIGILP